MTDATTVPSEAQGVVLDGRLVCIVDDDELCRSQIALILAQKKMRTLEASDTNELQALIDRRMPDCILLDYDLVSENGLFALERLKQRYEMLAPIVMVSANETQRTAVQAFRTGATDFVSKRRLNALELTTAVRRAIELRRRDEIREEELERLRRNTTLDERTGLLSRHALEQRLGEMDEAARRHRRHYGLIGLTVAHLDEVLDRFGVVAVDRVLRSFGNRMRELVRATDLCGTWSRGTLIYAVDSFNSPATFAAIVRRLGGQAAFEVDIAAAHVAVRVVAAGALHPDDGASLGDLLGAVESRLADELRAFRESATGAADWVMLPSEKPDAGAEPTERRREPRLRTLKQGRIQLDGLPSIIECMVRNLSANGAGLRLTTPTAIPEFFSLRISNGEPRRVRKCWHHNTDLGVEFLPG